MTHHTDPELLNNVLELLTEQGHTGFAEGTKTPSPPHNIWPEILGNYSL